MDLPENLQNQLDEYNANFELTNKAIGDLSLLQGANEDERLDKAKELLVTVGLPIGLINIIQIANFGESEATKLKASQYLVDKVLKDATPGELTEVEKLFQRLTERDPASKE